MATTDTFTPGGRGKGGRVGRARWGGEEVGTEREGQKRRRMEG